MSDQFVDPAQIGQMLNALYQTTHRTRRQIEAILAAIAVCPSQRVQRHVPYLQQQITYLEEAALKAPDEAACFERLLHQGLVPYSIVLFTSPVNGEVLESEVLKVDHKRKKIYIVYRVFPYKDSWVLPSQIQLSPPSQ